MEEGGYLSYLLQICTDQLSDIPSYSEQREFGGLDFFLVSGNLLLDALLFHSCNRSTAQKLWDAFFFVPLK